MPKSIILFFRKTSKLFGIIILVVIFFLVYNTYLVDRSLVNLKLALNQAAEAQTIEDFQKIKPFLKVPLLKEIAKKTASPKVLMTIELAENIASAPQKIEQVEDIKFYLKAVIEAKEKERGGFLAVLDRLNTRIFAPQVKLSERELEAKRKDLLARIETIKDKNLLQEAYYNLGNLYVQSSNLIQAEEAFLKVVEINPKNELAIKSGFNLAWAYKSQGKFDKAMAKFEELSKEFPEIELASLSQYQVADTLYKKGEYLEARDKYAQLAYQHPKFEVADLALAQAGYISFYNLNDRDATLLYFSELEEKFSKTEITQHVRSIIRETMAGDFRRQGYNLLKEKKYNEAIEDFEKAVEIAPFDGSSFSGMGLGFYWLNERQEALNKAKKAIEVSPKNEVALINSLFVHINSEKIDEAIKIGEEALSKVLIKRSEFYYNLGYAYLLNAKSYEAIIQFDHTISLNPDFIFAYNNSACAFWSTAQYSKAITMFKEAIAREPDYTDAHFNLGVSYFYLKRPEDAYAEFKKVSKINPDYPQTKDYLNRIREILKYEP